MDREQEEMQFLGLWGIYTESYKIIISCKKIFLQIALALILPLSFIFFLHDQVSKLLFLRMILDAMKHIEFQPESPPYIRIDKQIINDVAIFLCFDAAFFTVLCVLSLLSTSAVVYTIARIYTSGSVEDSFRDVIRTVVPRVWRRLMATFLYMFTTGIIYSVVTMFILIVYIQVVGFGTWFSFSFSARFGAWFVMWFFVDMFVLLLVAHAVGFVYLTVVWHLANVVSVLEDDYGAKAMVKGKDLIRGKLWLAMAIVLILYVGSFPIQWGFGKWVERGVSGLVGTMTRVVCGVVSCLLLSMLVLFKLVVQTVVYLVCKSYHHERIDRSALSDRLASYLGGYVPLTAMDVQLEQFHV